MYTKVVQKAIKISSDLFPKSFKKSFHVCIGFQRNTPLAIGLNNPYVESPKAHRIARMTGVSSFGYLHAEMDLISKLLGKYYIDQDLKIVVIRRNKAGELAESKPCKNCNAVLSAFGISKIWYSTRTGEINGP